jgi:hypothetical protein
MQAPDYQQTSDPSPEDTLIASLSWDGYVRLTFESFQQAKIVHLYSGMDEDKPASLGVGASFSAITGYTEWVSNSAPAITIGWDWQLTGGQGMARFIHSGMPGSNLMFVDRNGRDLGTEQTTQLLLNWLNAFSWQPETLKAINNLSLPVNFDSC